MQPINPSTLASPRGYSHGIVAQGRVLFVAGQIGWDAQGRLVADSFAAQFDQALANILTVVGEAGGDATSIGRFTIFVVDKTEYLRALKAVGEAYRTRMGCHYPAMTLIEVKSLLEDGAKVEIEATAVIP
jgi:enamine deaminase RidA (YjgF/YER057c/UK114 family)